MNLPAVLMLIALAIGFGGFYMLNFDFSAGAVSKDALQYNAPYYFKVGDLAGTLNAFFFVFLFSLLFFGYSAPIALGIEGAKFASLLLGGSLHAYDFIFLFPEVLAAYSAVLLGQGVLHDFEGSDTVFAKWQDAVKFFVIAFALLLALQLLRGVVVAGAK